MRGYFGIGIEHTKTEQNIGTLFRSAMAFNASFVFTIGKRYEKQSSDTTKSFRHIPLYHYVDLNDLMNHLPYGCKLIGIEIIEGTYLLPLYEHPERVCYLLGAEDNGLSKKALEMCHEIIKIPSRYCLNVAVAGSIVMYDRFIKRNYIEKGIVAMRECPKCGREMILGTPHVEGCIQWECHNCGYIITESITSKWR